MSKAPTIADLEKPIFKRAFSVRKKQKVWQWIEENIRIPKESGSRLCGPIDTGINAYFRFLYDAYGDPKTRFITLVKSAQIGATLFLKNLICYDVEHSGVAQLYITSTGDQAIRFNDRELEPHFRLCAAVEALAIREKSLWSKAEKVWKNGATLGIVGSNSVSQLASRTVERLKMDETDKWPAESEREAAAVDLAEARTKTFEDRRKVVSVSTPTVEGGTIWQRYLRGTREHFECPCPNCETWQVLEFFHTSEGGGVFWPPYCQREDGTWDLDRVERETAYECKSCKFRWQEIDKRKIIGQARPIVTNPNAQPSNRSFHINALYSPFETWGGVARAYLMAEATSGGLHDFYNNYLGKPWAGRATVLKRSDLLTIKENSPKYHLGELPFSPLLITMTVDVQLDCYWWTIRAWGPRHISALIDYGSAISPQDLELIYLRQYTFGGQVFQPYKVMIDSGAYAKRRYGVYDICLASRGRFFPAKGSDKGKIQTPITQTLIEYRGAHLWLQHFDDEIYKEVLYCRRIRDREGPAWYLPQDIGNDYCVQLTAEQLIERRKPAGGVELVWECSSRNNHLGDCEKMQLVFGDLAGVVMKLDGTPAGQRDEPEPRQGASENPTMNPDILNIPW